MSISPLCVAWVGGFFEGAQSFVDFSSGNTLGEFGSGDSGGFLAEGEEFSALSGI